MTVQQTSLFAYEEIKPHINRRQQQVLECFQNNKILNNRQIKELLGWEINCVTGRVKELREKNLLCVHSERRDPVSGRTTLYWRKTNV